MNNSRKKVREKHIEREREREREREKERKSDPFQITYKIQVGKFTANEYKKVSSHHLHKM